MKLRKKILNGRKSGKTGFFHIFSIKNKVLTLEIKLHMKHSALMFIPFSRPPKNSESPTFYNVCGSLHGIEQKKHI